VTVEAIRIMMITDAVHLAGRGLCKAGRRLRDLHTMRGVWFDVGAYKCEYTGPAAFANPSLDVYAFEPNLKLAAGLFKLYPNVHVVPMAVAEQDGCAEFNLTAFQGTSSLLPIDEDAVQHWSGRESIDLRTIAKMMVPTIRLDTFMGLMGIERVDFMKIDAQGMDLAVVKSCGERLKSFKRIYLEVYVTSHPLYREACRKDEVMEYMTTHNFELAGVEVQSDGQEENLTFVNREAS
jgi:FkbM family methyltransferase